MTRSIRDLPGFAQADEDLFRKCVHEALGSGGDPRRTLAAWSKECTDGFLECMAAGDSDHAAKLCWAGLVVANTQSGFLEFAKSTGRPVSDDDLVASAFQEKATGNALESALDAVSSPLRERLQSSLACWKKTTVGRDAALDAMVKRVGKETIERSEVKRAGCALLVAAPLFGVLSQLMHCL